MKRWEIIVRSKHRERLEPLRIGPNTTTKVVANIGLSPGVSTAKEELRKAHAAVALGADVIADHTITPKVDSFLKQLVNDIGVPISTVPYYEVGAIAAKERGSVANVTTKDIIATIEKQAILGIDIMTIHAALTREILESISKSKRLIKIPSRGGSWVAAHMLHHNVENPLYENLDEILDILKAHNTTLSIGPSVRPGSVVDGIDEFALAEISIMKEIVERASRKNVQVIAEYGGHIRANIIPVLMSLVKSLCHGVPIRTLIISTDVAAAYDHVAAAIAGAIAAINSANVLVAITCAEHLGLPRYEDFIDGITSFKVAAHIADLAKTIDLQGEIIDQDRAMSIARSKREWTSMWDHAINGARAKELHDILQRGLVESDNCTMCGNLCAYKIVDAFLRKDSKDNRKDD